MMKNLITILVILISMHINAQTAEYNISSYLSEGIKAPNTHHIGDAWLNFLVEADEGFNKNITQATFNSNSTLDWHKHTTSQIIIVIEGKGYYQEIGKEPVILKKGDVINCKKDTEHWHTSSANSSISYIAIYGKEPTIWTKKLTQEYYNSVAKKLEEK